MKVEADQKCFVCGPENRVGLQVQFNIDSDSRKAEATVVISDNYQGWQGVVHGGIISTLLDEAAIYACRPLSIYAVTAGLDVRFFKPVSTNIELRVISEVQSSKRRMAVVKSCVWQNGELMSEAVVKVVFTDKKEVECE